jgi:capsular polysaccharide biosynthesis protein
MRARISVKDRCRNDESIVFPLVCTNGYYHWLFEYLPKIRALRYYQQQTGDSPSVLIRPNPPRWMRESLSLLGISKKRRVQWDRLQSSVKKAIVSTHRVHLPRREYGRYEPCRTAYQWLKSEAVAGIKAKQQFSNRIFISREDTNRRNIANDTEIYDVLRDFGFEPYVLSDYRFEEQVAMFRNATAVVGVHGAGLSNIVFGDNIDILEIVPQDMRRITYCCLSKILNHTYQVMHTPAPVENLVLDPDNLSQKLNQIT